MKKTLLLFCVLAALVACSEDEAEKDDIHGVGQFVCDYEKVEKNEFIITTPEIGGTSGASYPKNIHFFDSEDVASIAPVTLKGDSIYEHEYLRITRIDPCHYRIQFHQRLPDARLYGCALYFTSTYTPSLFYSITFTYEDDEWDTHDISNSELKKMETESLQQ